MKGIPVGILGATGMVGQRFIELLKNHPWFEVAVVAASPRSAGKKIGNLTIQEVEKDIQEIAKKVRIVFSAIDMDKQSLQSGDGKEDIRRIEDAYASLGAVVVSNNSAHRWTPDVPMIMPEINAEHLALIDVQQKNHGWKKGFVVVKPNCSIQSYVPLLTPLLKFKPQRVTVTTLQAVSGAGKTLESWPEMQENVIPYIGGEEEKSEKEPMKIWGGLKGGTIAAVENPVITATCIRVPLEDGHMASVSVSFGKKLSAGEIISAWKSFNPLKSIGLPSAPDPFITVFDEEDRPQTRLDRMIAKGMGISAGRVRQHDVFNYSFIGLSHNTIRGAAGGAILTAELLFKKGYIK